MHEEALETCALSSDAGSGRTPEPLVRRRALPPEPGAAHALAHCFDSRAEQVTLDVAGAPPARLANGERIAKPFL